MIPPRGGGRGTGIIGKARRDKGGARRVMSRHGVGGEEGKIGRHVRYRRVEASEIFFGRASKARRFAEIDFSRTIYRQVERSILRLRRGEKSAFFREDKRSETKIRVVRWTERQFCKLGRALISRNRVSSELCPAPARSWFCNFAKSTSTERVWYRTTRD